MKKLEVKSLKFLYDTKSTDGISNVTFDIKENEIVSLIGPSGSGKSTTLKLIYGILEKQEGEINSFDYKLGYVPQATTLDENTTVFNTLNLSLNYLNDKDKQENQIRSTLSTLQITNDIHSPIKNLSGGQRQRVIIALALIHNPQIILLDEPFGHLDQVLRLELIRELFNIFKDKKISTLWVTHDTNEALAFSDRVILLNFGKVIQNAIPEKIYKEPKNIFVAEFIGIRNTIIATYEEQKSKIKVLKKEIDVQQAFNSSELVLYCQNDAIKYSANGLFSAIVQNYYFYGTHYWVECKVDERYIWVLAQNDINLSKGQKIRFDIELERCHLSTEL